MRLSISQLREKLAAQRGFAEVEQVDESIIRAVRESESQPFAVYYFDIADELPETKDKLTKYQDRVIGRRYFEGRKSLQWSNYLYFLTTTEGWRNPALRETRELIELDRLYARKFVIPEEEIKSVLDPPVVSPSANIRQANVLSIWSEFLAEKMLDAAVLSNDDLPTRLSLIENPPTTKSPKAKARRIQIGSATFLDSLQLKKFRPFPIQRDFDFGKVNLIVGPNGSGKTSLLEAIELFFCGRNKRNPGSRAPYELFARLSGGRSENATRRRDLQLFRDRNLSWYGQTEVKTNRLYQSFSQFNFLDTDAAVSLSDSTERLEDDLSNLLVGPDASKTWHDIERVSEAISSKLRELQPLKRQVTDELAVLEKQLSARDKIPHESESIRARLIDMLDRLEWTSDVSSEVLDSSVVGPLSELAALARQATGATWAQSPVSHNALANYIRQTDAVIERVEPDLSPWIHLSAGK